MAELIKSIIGRGHKIDRLAKGQAPKDVSTNLTLFLSKYHDGIVGKQCLKLEISDNQNIINLKRDQVEELSIVCGAWLYDYDKEQEKS